MYVDVTRYVYTNLRRRNALRPHSDPTIRIHRGRNGNTLANQNDTLPDRVIILFFSVELIVSLVNLIKPV